MTVQPDDTVDIHVKLWLPPGLWVDMGPVVSVVDDFFTNVFTNVFPGRRVTDVRRLPSQEITITHGRSDGAAECEPSETSFVLWNDDGFLTPDNFDSPWWAPDGTGFGEETLCWIHVGDVTDRDTRFFGKVTAAVPEWPHGDLSDGDLSDEELHDLGNVDVNRLGFGIVTISAVGYLRDPERWDKPVRSAMTQRMFDPRYRTHIADSWPMEDGKDAQFLASAFALDTGPRGHMSQTGLTLAADDSLWGSLALPQVSSGQDASFTATTSHVRRDLLDTKWAVEWNTKIPKAPDDLDTLVIMEAASDGTVGLWRLTLGFDFAGNFLRIEGVTDPLDANAISFRRNLPENLFGEFWTTFRLEVEQSGTGIAWRILWGPVTPGDVGDPQEGIGSTFASASCGVLKTINWACRKAPPGGVSIGQLLVHDGIANGWQVGPDVGWQGERSARRAERFGQIYDIPIQFVYGPPGSGLTHKGTSLQMGAQKPAPILDLLRECAKTGNALLTERRDAFGLRYLDRGHRYNPPVSFTLDAKAKSQITNPFAPTKDDENRCNDFTAQKIDGSSVRAYDPTLDDDTRKVRRFERGDSFSIWDEHLVKDYAGWGFHLGMDRSTRVAVTIDLFLCGDTLTTGDLTMRQAWARANVGDRFQVVNLPPQFPTWPILDQIIEGWSETLGPKKRDVELHCSPTRSWIVAVYGATRMQVEDAVLNAPTDETQTTIVVSVPGDPFTLDADFYPMDIVVDEVEVMTLTEPPDAFVPQTFANVVRNVNGYARAHRASATVRINDDAVKGL